MKYQVALLNFEGPLDLLLQLVEKSRLDSTEVSLATVTDQYIAHLESLDRLEPYETSRFTALAAKLLYIKSLALLPDAQNQESAEEIEDLKHQLEEYGVYRDAAKILLQQAQKGQRSYPRLHRAKPVTEALPPNVTPPALQRALQDALSRYETPKIHIAPTPSITIEQMTVRMQSFIKTQPQPTLQGWFSQLQNQTEVVVAFLAALELWKAGSLSLTQSGQFSIIKVDYAQA